ncbi:MAG: hypothetical protein ABJD24_02110, partial [Acidimicrobiales bacterium]
NTAPGLTFSVYRACSGMPPQAASPPPFSNPLLFNNVFDDNRAGNWQSTGTSPGVHGIGAPGDTAPVYHWDMGTADGTGVLSPTNSIINDTAGHGFNTSATNQVADGAPDSNLPKFKAPFNLRVTISPWRVQPRFRPTAIVGVSLPANAIGNYHLLDATSPAVNAGAASKNVAPFGLVNAPSTDIDNDGRPAPVDEGADEIKLPSADLAITKTHSPGGAVAFGATVTYTLAVHNNGPDGVTGAAITDGFPAGLSSVSWTCSASAGSTCPAASGTGNITGALINVANGGTVTFTATTTASPATKALPALPVLDSFNRTATNLNTGAPAGTNWTQPNALGSAAIRTNTNQAQCSNAGLLTCAVGPAYWNGTSPVFLAKQGAAFTFVNSGGVPAAPLTGSALLMAVTGSPSGSIYPSGVRVMYTTGAASSIVNTATVSVPSGTVDPSAANNTATDTVTFSGNRVLVSTITGTTSVTDIGSVPIPTGSFATGNTLSAIVNGDGTVDIWKTNGGVTYLGRVSGAGLTAAAYVGGGRVGMLVPNTARVDDFRGATVT